MAILGATALGGILGSRISKLPVLLGAGAAAFALMRGRSHPSSTNREEPDAQPSPSPAIHSTNAFVLEWLESQSHAERDAPSVEFPFEDKDPPESSEPYDSYVPLPLLPDEDVSPPAEFPGSYAKLTEPAVSLPEETKPADESLPDVTTAPSFPGPAGLCFEPMPALKEENVTLVGAHEPTFLPPPPPFSSHRFVFEGGNLPDHIEVAPSDIALEPVMAVEPEPPLVDTPAPSSNVPEITVELASPGEASFDPPLTGLPTSTWPPAKLESLDLDAAAPETSPVVADGAFVLLPQPQVQNSILPKAPNTAPWVTKYSSAINTPDLQGNPKADPPVLDASKGKKRPHSEWNSWWQGD
ncbi:MAG: hypothetical protein R3F13_21075 [Prosthecobacter sp.]